MPLAKDAKGLRYEWEHKVSKEFAGLGATMKTLGQVEYMLLPSGSMMNQEVH